MVYKFVRHFVIPVVAFTGFVSTGFAAWVFSDQNAAIASIQGTVNVTPEVGVGVLELNQGGNTSVTGTEFSDDYTSETSFYTLAFSQDLSQDETVGVTLYPSIEYIFSCFYPPNEGDAYYINYRTEYLSGGIYDQYVTMIDASLTASGSQTSQPIMIDLSNMVAMTGENEGKYMLESTLVPSLGWKSRMKPTTETSYNSFLQQINNSTETFNIFVYITYGADTTSA